MTIGRTVFLEDVCTCILKPYLNQCSDLIYAQTRLNMQAWREQYELAEKNAVVCSRAGCGCRDAESQMRQAALSTDSLRAKGWCPYIEVPTLKIPTTDQHGSETPPMFMQLACAEGTCTECGVDKLLPSDCAVWLSARKIKARKSVKCFRSENKKTGKKSYQKELHVVEMTVLEFASMMRTLLQVYVVHLYWDKWESHGGHLMLSNFRLERTWKRIIGWTDYAARVKLVASETACCQSTKQATVGICVCQHSPHDQMVKRVKRVPEMVETLRQVGNRTDIRVQLGEQQTEYQKIRVFKTDIWRSFHTEKGNADTHNLFMRDIANFYKHGKFLFATKIWIDGEVFGGEREHT